MKRGADSGSLDLEEAQLRKRRQQPTISLKLLATLADHSPRSSTAPATAPAWCSGGGSTALRRAREANERLQMELALVRQELECERSANKLHAAAQQTAAAAPAAAKQPQPQSQLQLQPQPQQQQPQPQHHRPHRTRRQPPLQGSPPLHSTGTRHRQPAVPARAPQFSISSASVMELPGRMSPMNLASAVTCMACDSGGSDAAVAAAAAVGAVSMSCMDRAAMDDDATPPPPPRPLLAGLPLPPQPVLRREHVRLLLLRHASKCTSPAGTCSATPHCASLKKLWAHMTTCADPCCPVDQCASSRQLLSHYASCDKIRCPICGPVRDAIRRRYQRSRGSPTDDNASGSGSGSGNDNGSENDGDNDNDSGSGIGIGSGIGSGSNDCGSSDNSDGTDSSKGEEGHSGSDCSSGVCDGNADNSDGSGGGDTHGPALGGDTQHAVRTRRRHSSGMGERSSDKRAAALSPERQGRGASTASNGNRAHALRGPGGVSINAAAANNAAKDMLFF